MAWAVVYPDMPALHGGLRATSLRISRGAAVTLRGGAIAIPSEAFSCQSASRADTFSPSTRSSRGTR